MARLTEKSRLKSRLPSPFLHRPVFLFYFPFLVSPSLFGGSGVTVFALFFIFFHPSSVAHSSHWKEASLTQEDGKDVPSFYTIRHTSSLLDTSLPRFCQRQAQCQSKCSIRDMICAFARTRTNVIYRRLSRIVAWILILVSHLYRRLSDRWSNYISMAMTRKIRDLRMSCTFFRQKNV